MIDRYLQRSTTTLKTKAMSDYANKRANYIKLLDSLGIKLPSEGTDSVPSIDNFSLLRFLLAPRPRRQGVPRSVMEREELTEVLESMGVKLPQAVKPPVQALLHRVVKALDFSQTHAELFGLGRAPDLSKLKPWNASENLGQGIAQCATEEYDSASAIFKEQDRKSVV